MKQRVSFIWIPPYQVSLQLYLWSELDYTYSTGVCPCTDDKEGSNVSWPCIYEALYLPRCTEEIIVEMVCGINCSISLVNYQVHQAIKDQCCSHERMGRGYSTQIWPPQQHAEKPGASIMFPCERPTPNLQLRMRWEDTLHIF